MRHLAFAAVLVIAMPAMAQSHQSAAQGSGPGPARDARGILVISSPATAPAGANRPVPSGRLVPAPDEQAVFAPEPGPSSYPPCSAKVTDNCLQTYQRGIRPAGR